MKRFTLIVSALVIALFGNAQQCSWNALGLVDSNQASCGQVNSLCMSIGKNNVPYLAFMDVTDGNKMTVSQYANGAFGLVGPEGFTPNTVVNTAMTTDTSGMPWVLFDDNNVAQMGSVMRYNGSTWQYVGDSGFIGAYMQAPAMAFDKKTNTPYIMYDNGVGYVMKYIRNKWVNVGPPNFAKGSAGACNIAIDKNGVPYIAYIVGALNTEVVVQRFNGTSWDSLGTSLGVSPGNVQNCNMVLDKNGVPIVAYQLNGIYSSVVMRFNGSTWDTIGNAHIPTSFNPQLAIDTAGVIYVGYDNISTSDKMCVVYYNGTSWVNAGNSNFSNIYIKDMGLGFDANNNLYASGYCGSTAFLAQLVGSTWQMRGTNGYDKATYLSMTMDKKRNTPYMVFQDNSAGYGPSVMKYSGGAWNYVGTPGFVAGPVNYTTIAVDTAGTPYIAYDDYNHSDKATVMKYNGTSWVTVGTAGFTAGSVTYTKLFISPSNVVYLGYADGNNSNKATVIKFNGTSWVAVGFADFTNSGILYMNLAMDKTGGFYAAYEDQGSVTGGASVRKFNGTSWVSVGAPGFTTKAVSSVSLAIDTNNIPYVSFTDGFEGNHLSVMRYNGTAWVYYSASGFSPGTATSTSIAIDPLTNAPYISFIDGSKANKASVMYYNNGWQYAADPNGVSNGITTTTSLAFNSSGTPYLAYTDISPFVRTLACPLFDTLKGMVYADKNYNCTYDAGDVIAPKVKIDAYYYGRKVASTLTDNSGNYLFPYMIKGGKYTIKPDFTPTPYYSTRCGIATGKDTIQTNSNMVLNIPLKDTLKQITQIFGPVDGGMGGPIHAFIKYDSVMYAGGYFTTAGNSGGRSVVKWDGQHWRKMQASTGFNDDVYCIGIYKQKLFAGGAFTTIEGGTSAGHIAQWNGANWTPVGAGINGAVEALKVYNGLLYTAGGFSSPYVNIATWNGSAYGTVGGVTGGIYDMAVYNGNLYVGGNVVSAGGIATKSIAMWNGTTWDSVSTKGINNTIEKLCVYKNKLYAGGLFDSAGGKPAAHIACWDGTTWSPVGTGINGNVTGFGIYNNKLYVGGTFTTAGGAPTSNIAIWDGSTWTGINGGPDLPYAGSLNVQAICSFDSVLYIGGSFIQSGTTATSSVAQWPCAKVIMGGNVFTDNANNCTYALKQDSTVSQMKVLIIDNLKDTSVVYTNYAGNYSDTLSSQMTYTVQLAPPSGYGLKIHCPASKKYTDSASFNYTMNFGIDTAALYTDSIAYIVDTCYADSAEHFTYTLYGHTFGFFTGDTITGSFNYGDGTFDTIRMISTGAATYKIKRQFSHTYFTSGNYTTTFKLLSRDVPSDSVSKQINASINCTYVKGILYFDRNKNCVYDPVSDMTEPNLTIDAIYNNKIVTSTKSDASGNFLLAPLHKGLTYSIVVDTIASHGFAVNCNGSLLAGGAATHTNVSVVCNAGFDLTGSLTVCIDTPKGNSASISACIYNNLCHPVSGSLRLILDTAIHITSTVSDSVAHVSGDTLTWNYNNIGVYTTQTECVNLSGTISNLPTGDSVFVTMLITPTKGDSVPSNNKFTYWVKAKPANCVGLPFDPNEKSVLPEGNISPTQQLSYTIHFQNTGTAVAKNMVVIDTLSPYVDPTTLKITSASSEVVTTIVSGNIAKFTFDNINLPDTATSKTTSIGVFKYTINPAATAAPGDVIKNSAGIYFDANPVVKTNTTKSPIVGAPLAVNHISTSLNIAVFPNPFTTTTSIVFNTDGTHYLELDDVTGRKIESMECTGKQYELQRKNLAAGVYFIKAFDAEHKYVAVQKVVVQ